MRLLYVIGFSLVLLSCSMGPDYQRPTTEVEDRFRMAGASEDLPSLANLSWWELLRDEQLQQLIRTALAENRNLQQAVATVEEFRARALIARSDYFPGVTVAASAPAGRKANFLFPGFASPFINATTSSRLIARFAARRNRRSRQGEPSSRLRW